MPSLKQTLRHVFDGGWATDFGTIAEVGIAPDGLVRIPFLTEAKNVTYELDGGTHKIGGTTRMNATQFAGGAEMVGLYDFWQQVPGSSPTQLIMCHAGTVVGAAALDGDFTDVSTATVGALTDDAVPSYSTFDDLLIVASDGTGANDEPASYDGTTYQKLAGSPPHFSFSEFHKNRLWAAGNNGAPSRLYFSAFVDPEVWSAAGGAGFIDIDPNDGDRITAIASHKDNLWVFKGPYSGSIHRIVGSAPTGSDSFGRQTFVRGLGCVAHNTVFRFRDDLGFMWSDGSIHSLAATASFGDFNEAALSQPINGWLSDHVNGSRLTHAWAATDSVKGIVLFTLATDSSTTNNTHLMMDYRFQRPRWAFWTAFSSGSVASVVDSGVKRLFGGSNDGYARRLLKSARSIDGLTNIAANTVTPFMSYASPHITKTLERVSVGITPKGKYNLDFGWTRDEHADQTQSVDQNAAGTALGSFVLGISTLGGATYADRFMSLEEGGEFRQIQYRVSNAGISEDLEVHMISTTINRGAESSEN